MHLDLRWCRWVVEGSGRVTWALRLSLQRATMRRRDRVPRRAACRPRPAHPRARVIPLLKTPGVSRGHLERALILQPNFDFAATKAHGTAEVVAGQSTLGRPLVDRSQRDAQKQGGLDGRVEWLR